MTGGGGRGRIRIRGYAASEKYFLRRIFLAKFEEDLKMSANCFQYSVEFDNSLTFSTKCNIPINFLQIYNSEL